MTNSKIRNRRVQLSCTPTVASNTQTRSTTVIGIAGSTTDAAIPLQVTPS